MCLCTCMSKCMRAYVRMSLSHSIFRCARSLDPCTAASPAPGSRVGAAGRHSQDVSLSLWQCSDRATHLSTDALPVSGGVVRAVPLFLSLTLSFLSSSRPQTLSPFLALLSTRRISSHFFLHVLSISLSLPPFVSPTLRRFVLCSTVRVSLHS